MTLTWTPIFVVAMKAALDADVYRMERASATRRLASVWCAILGGRNLNAAPAFLATLADFEKECGL